MTATNIKVITFEEDKELEDQNTYVLIHLDGIPDRIRMDYQIRNQNVQEGNTLCKWCNGTGNQFFYTYSDCPQCNATGINNE